MPTTDVNLNRPIGHVPVGGGAGGLQLDRTPTVTEVLARYADRIEAARPPVVVAPERRVAAREVKLSDDGSLFLSATGYFVTKAGQAQPPNLIEMGNATYAAAVGFAERDVNVFAKPGISVEQKGMTLTALQTGFNSALEQAPIPGGFQTPEQRLQMRSCVAPLILDLARSCSPRKAEEKALQTRALQMYFDCLRNEPHALNRNFMIYDLERHKAELPADVRPIVTDLMREVAQTSPPYEDWFKNGKDKLVVEYNVGHGFWEEETAFWIADGFAKQDLPDGSMKLTKRLEVNGVGTNLELVMRNGPHAMFQKMNDPKVDIVVYSGHANYGRNVLDRLKDAPALEGKKVFFGLQCGGKYVHNAILEKFDGLQVVQSKNSSYGHEDRRTLKNALEGFARRQSWDKIATTNLGNNSDNYYFPTDSLVTKRAEDRDHDGVLDAWDRVVQYNTFKPQAALDKELTPTDPGVKGDRIDGHGLSAALGGFLRIAGYNEWAEPLQNQRVATEGYYEGTAQDPILRIRDVQEPDGERCFVEVNKYYAHASEGTLGAVLAFEVGAHAAREAGLNAADAKLSGLLMTAKLLDVDTNPHERAIFAALLKFEKLPAGISFEDVLHAAKEDEHMSAGTRGTLASLKQVLAAKNIVVA